MSATRALANEPAAIVGEPAEAEPAGTTPQEAPQIPAKTAPLEPPADDSPPSASNQVQTETDADAVGTAHPASLPNEQHAAIERIRQSALPPALRERLARAV